MALDPTSWLEFDAENTTVVTTGLQLDLNSALTFETWFWPRAPKGSQTATLFQAKSDSSNTFQVDLLSSNGKEWENIYVAWQGHGGTLVPAPKITLFAWHYFAVSVTVEPRSSNQFEVVFSFVFDEATYSLTQTFPAIAWPQETSNQVVLGGPSSTRGEFAGSMAQVTLWNMARTTEQMRQDGQTLLQATSLPTGVAAFWPLAEPLDAKAHPAMVPVFPLSEHKHVQGSISAGSWHNDEQEVVIFFDATSDGRTLSAETVWVQAGDQVYWVIPPAFQTRFDPRKGVQVTQQFSSSAQMVPAPTSDPRVWAATVPSDVEPGQKAVYSLDAVPLAPEDPELVVTPGNERP